MASTYKFRIEHQSEGFRFVLYPNNSNSQAIGMSGQAFKSAGDCQRALMWFRTHIAESDVIDILDYGETEKNKFYPKLVIENEVLFFRKEKPLLQGKFNCIRWAKEIQNNIMAPLK